MHRIKELRLSKGLSQKALADLVDLSQQAVGKWETGRAEPDICTIIKLADYFNVTTDYLLGRTDTPNIYRHDIDVPGTDEAYLLTTEKEPPTQKKREQLRSDAETGVNGSAAISLRPDELPRNRQELEQLIRQLIDQRDQGDR